MVVVGVGGISYERGTPVAQTLPWNMFDLTLQRDGIASATRDMAQTPGPDLGLLPGLVVSSDTMYKLNGFKKSTPPQHRYLVFHYLFTQHQVDGFVGELTF